MSDGYKKCCDCKQMKSLQTEFWSGQSVCKDCAKIRRSKWGKDNLEHLREYDAQRRRARGIKEIRRFSQEEIAYLQEHYPAESITTIAEHLGRSNASINQMISRLKLARPDKVARFWSKVDKTDGCWIWTARKHKDGYGQVRFNYKRMIASRLAWELTNGPIPEGMFVCHKCDNPACVRPDHLWLGTPADNNWDKIKKGRHIKKVQP